MSQSFYNLTIYFNHKLLLFFKVNCINLFQHIFPEKQGAFVYNRDAVYLDYNLLTISELYEILQYCNAMKPSRLVTKFVIDKC